jgi:hypothetical protein
MKSRCPYDLDRLRNKGVFLSIGRRLTSGKLIRARNLREAADILSDRLALAQALELEIVGLNGSPSLFIYIPSLLARPHIIVGYHESGLPILIAVEDLKGHFCVVGLTQAGKSLVLGLIGYQLVRLGHGAVFLGMKAPDPMPLAHMRWACESKTRLDDQGHRVSAPFAYFTLEFNTRTRSLNCQVQWRWNLPKWLKAGVLLKSLGRDGFINDRLGHYFTTSEQALLQKVPDWGDSLRELRDAVERVKQTREEYKSTSGLRHELAQLAEIDQLNLPAGHPSSIDVAAMLKERGVIYFDPCCLDLGSVGTAVAAYFLQTVIFIKRNLIPDRNKRLYIFIDEGQKLPLSLVAGWIEQLAAYGMHLGLTVQNISQLGDYAETISMTQTRIVFSAVPEGLTDRLIRSLCGTAKEWAPSFSVGQSNSLSAGESVGPSGTTVSTGSVTGEQLGFSLTEHDAPAWTTNDTLNLNNNTDEFLVSVTAGHFGPTPIRCQRGGVVIPFDVANALAEDTLKNSPNGFLPGQPPVKQLPAPATPNPLADKRAAWLATLKAKAEKIRNSLPR